MARIRSIKPSFWTSFTVARLSKNARLTFLGLLNQCDDEGRFYDEPRMLKAAIWPLDDDITARVVVKHLDEMVAVGMVTRYVVNRVQLLVVNNFKEHQRLDHPQRSKLPAPPESPANTTEAVREHSGNDTGMGREESRDTPEAFDERSPKNAGGKGKERKGKEFLSSISGDGVASIDPAAYQEDLDRLMAAGAPHERLALQVLLAAHSAPYMLVLELASTASGLHVIRGNNSRRPADVADVMRAVAEMAANDAPWSVSLFRGYVRRIADRPPEPASVEERQQAKLEREITARAATARIALVEGPRVETAEERARLDEQRKAAMDHFRREFRANNPEAAA